MLAVAVALLAAPVRAASSYVRITARGVNLRTAPRTSSAVVGKADRGDVFRLVGRRGSWYKIVLFTGEPRYVHRALARKTRYRLSLPRSSRKRGEIREAVLKAEKRAVEAAARKYPIPRNAATRRWEKTIDKAIDYELLLTDRYDLVVFHHFGVQAPAYDELRNAHAEQPSKSQSAVRP